MTTMTDTVPDFDHLERVAEVEIDRLEAAVSALSLESLGGDQDVLGELDDLEQQLDDRKRALVRLQAARVEQGKRDAQARQDAATEARAEAFTEARRLQAKREALAEKVDEGAVAFAQALVEFDRVASEQERQLRLAGRDGTPARPRSWQFECCLLNALRDAGAPHGILTILPPSVAQVRPLAENDHRSIDPLPTTKEKTG
jgi:hypothetical protein